MLSPKQMIFSLKTTRFEEQHAFYTLLLGPPKGTSQQGSAIFQLPGCSLVLWETDVSEPREHSPLQLCFQVENLDKALTDLPEGVDASSVRIASHGREVFLRDADGNVLIVYEPDLP
ncbi:MAG: hypothetical protein QNK37_10315 [Acidobacteriota bacterium]|nr:hypothetical protein [Acidobacteriota bacterium]